MRSRRKIAGITPNAMVVTQIATARKRAPAIWFRNQAALVMITRNQGPITNAMFETKFCTPIRRVRSL